LKKLNHPNVVALLDVIIHSEAEQISLIFEYVE